WSTGETTPTISATQSGIYGVTVIFPATGFTMSDTAAVGIFQNNLTLQSQVEKPACFGDSTGAILLDLQGSNGEPSFSWSNPGGFSAAAEDLENLPAGNYFLTITDAGNCTLTEQFELTQPAEIELFANVVDVFCFGDSTGSIQATAAGSQAFSSFVWSNGVAS
ncbi:MAG: SprB repeat-containing protein, partial [Bacteroidota bacterium]